MRVALGVLAGLLIGFGGGYAAFGYDWSDNPSVQQRVEKAVAEQASGDVLSVDCQQLASDNSRWSCEALLDGGSAPNLGVPFKATVHGDSIDVK